MRPGAAKMRLRNALSFEQPIMRATLHAAAYLPSIVRPMSWLRELKLSDLPAEEALEIVCRQCGSARYETAAALSARTLPGACEGETVSLAAAYLDQVETRLRCRRCGGPGRLSRVWQDKLSAFVGGLP